ncbi:MAG: YkgJ family cysteine cluster protein [Candidatus Sumerlaeia bacterium]
MSKKKAIDSFTCARCGKCCTGAGFVNVTEEECRKIAGYLDMDLPDFLDKYTHGAAGYERWLIDGEGEDEPCIFLMRDEKGLASCRIEGDAKPEQCRDFPFKWRRRGFEEWCEGMKANNRQKDNH